jgi:hypothetical protein
MARAAKAIKPIINLIPPDPSSMSVRDLMGLLKVGQYASSLSEKELYMIAKLATQSSADLLEEWFEFDALKGTKAASGIIGTFLGRRTCCCITTWARSTAPSAPGASPRTAPAA